MNLALVIAAPAHSRRFVLGGPSTAPEVPAAAWVRWLLDRPWLLIVVAATVVVAVLIWSCVGAAMVGWRHRRLVIGAQQVTITPPPEVDAAGVGQWWANLYGLLTPCRWRRRIFGTAHVALEYRWSGRQLRVLVWVPGTIPAGPVAAAARAAWPGASTRIEPATSPVPTPSWMPGTVLAGAGVPHRRVARLAGASRLAWGAVATRAMREAGGALVPLLPAWYPLASDHEVDPTRAMIAAASGLHAGEHACVQVLARPAAPRQIARLRAGAVALRAGQHSQHGQHSPGGASMSVPERLLNGGLRVFTDVATELLSPRSARGSGGPARSAAGGDPLRERDVRPGLEKAVGALWEVSIRYAVTHTATGARTPIRAIARTVVRGDVRTGGGDRQVRGGDRAVGPVAADAVARRLTMLAHGLAAAFAVHAARNRLRSVRVRRPSQVLGSRVLRRGFLLCGAELAMLAGLPTDLAVPGLDRARARAVPAPIRVPAGGRGMKVLGRAEVGGHAVALPVVDARHHLHVLGSTGVGKSTLLAHLVLDDIRAGRGVVLIDPKGDLALEVIDRYPATALERLVLIDPDQPRGSATFNPLERLPGVDADVAVDNIVSIFASIFQRHWGPRIDDVLRVACLTLMRHPDPTLTNVPPLLNSKQFRAPFTVGLDDPAGLKGFWEWFESTPPQLRAQVIGPVLARLRSFLLRDFVRATIGPARSSFDMAQVLDGGVLIARLPKGQLGDDASRLLSSLVLASVWQAATARTRIPEARRRDASVYVDEAHNVLNLSGSVADMLAEARGYHLSLVLAHQDLAQLPRETQLALSANARNKIFFACSPEDAHELRRHTLPELDEHDLSHLDAYTAATRLIIANRATAAFTLSTNPPRPVTSDRAPLRQAIARATSPDDDLGAAMRDRAGSRRTARGSQAATDAARRTSRRSSRTENPPAGSPEPPTVQDHLGGNPTGRTRR